MFCIVSRSCLFVLFFGIWKTLTKAFSSYSILGFSCNFIAIYIGKWGKARFRRHITRWATGIDRFWGRILGGPRALPCNARNQTSSIITRPSKCNGGLCYCIASRYRIDNVSMRDSLVRIATTSDYRGASSTVDAMTRSRSRIQIRSAMRIRDIHNIRMP